MTINEKDYIKKRKRLLAEYYKLDIALIDLKKKHREKAIELRQQDKGLFILVDD